MIAATHRAIRPVLIVTLGAVAALAHAATPAAKPAAAPAAAAAAASAPPAEGPCTVRLGGSDLMQFDKKELRAPSTCKIFKVVMIHTGKLPVAAMGHNFVVTRTADLQAVANAGLAAGMKNNHLPLNDKRVLAASPHLVGGGQWVVIDIPMATLQKGGDYSYFCTFPGHSGVMKGKFVVL